jgi:hypothetical protein
VGYDDTDEEADEFERLEEADDHGGDLRLRRI